MVYAEISFTTTKDNKAVLDVFGQAFPNSNLQQAYAASQLRSAFPHETFAFGARNVSVNILLYFAHKTVTICLENAVNPNDVSVLKNQVDEYYGTFRDAFKGAKIKLNNSAAYITISGTRVFGERKTRGEAFIDELKSNWKELVLSFAGLAFIWLFTYRGWLSKHHSTEKIRDWALTFGPILLMLIISLLVVLLSKKSQKKFNFTL